MSVRYGYDNDEGRLRMMTALAALGGLELTVNETDRFATATGDPAKLAQYETVMKEFFDITIGLIRQYYRPGKSACAG